MKDFIKCVVRGRTGLVITLMLPYDIICEQVCSNPSAVKQLIIVGLIKFSDVIELVALSSSILEGGSQLTLINVNN
ncbi:hypothetical protein TW78_06050 [Vibrio coralliilyticus]|uniref:Uncharacterized protein n=1 Tax=Vibrio coralliilyticus TaxID=190893 RepID=A0A837G2U3_9VIBR|nr:hypothetical protein [Vibrio coralliilyticus]KJY75501.1 hypothetical protein TW78_06050 [Vibrio coralliilyticus]QOU29099.1 hypothetical protein TW71_010780 [Vibrio coralliilyticus]